MHDVIILGAGPAGMTAAVYCARKQLSVKLLTVDVGGQALWSDAVENYLGFDYIKGSDLVARFEEHLKKFKVDMIYKTAVSVKDAKDGWAVKDKTGATHKAQTVIITTGKSPRRLGVSGEDTWRGRGVTYCATCDAPLFAGSDVAVVGGGNSGAEATLQLADIASRVFLIETGPHLIADEILQSKIKAHPNVTVLTDATVTGINGNVLVESVDVHVTGKPRRLPVTGIFVEIGLTPNSACVKGLIKLNASGEIMVDRAGRTSRPGIFAAGDVTDEPDKQIIIAAGDGARAALAAYDYLLYMV